jgi:hypothetical protein
MPILQSTKIKYYSTNESGGEEIFSPTDAEVFEAGSRLRVREIGDLALIRAQKDLFNTAINSINRSFALKLLYSTPFGEKSLNRLIATIYGKGFIDGFNAKSEEVDL